MPPLANGELSAAAEVGQEETVVDTVDVEDACTALYRGTV